MATTLVTPRPLSGTTVTNPSDRTDRDLGFVRSFWLSEIRAGRAFSLEGLQAAVSGQNSHIQLWNPDASGITTIVRYLGGNVGASSSISILHYNTALTTLIGNGRNLLAGGADSVSELRSQTNIGVLGTEFEEFSIGDTNFRVLVDDWHTELGAGEGVLLALQVANIALRGLFRYIEV